jgi:cytochrome b561
MLRNTSRDWGAVAKGLHWLFVILILAEVPAGLLMTSTYGPAFKAPAAARLHVLIEQIHHTIGFSILALVALRLGWRLYDHAPSENTASSRAEHGAARAVQWSFYLLLALIPLSGWAALSSLGDSPLYGHTAIWFFNIDRLVPHLFPAQPLSGRFGYATFAKTHIVLLYVGLALIAVHVAAALWRHFRQKDYTLRSMWPLAGSPDRSGVGEL